MKDKIITTKRVSHWWQCRKCRKQFEQGVESVQYYIGEIYAEMCKDCVARGIEWAIKQAHKERNNV